MRLTVATRFYTIHAGGQGERTLKILSGPMRPNSAAQVQTGTREVESGKVVGTGRVFQVRGAAIDIAPKLDAKGFLTSPLVTQLNDAIRIELDTRQTSLRDPAIVEGEIRATGRFDAGFYLAEHKDVAEAGVDPLWHYVNFGEREARWPAKDFDPVFYKRSNADVRKADINLFRHYLFHGEQEGRKGRSSRVKAASLSRPSILFIGHDAIRAGAQKVLLETIRWYSKHTRYRLKTLLLAPGELTSEFTEVSDVYAINGLNEVEDEALKEFVRDKVDVVYVNTIAAGGIVPWILRASTGSMPTVICHVHEMAEVIRSYPREFSALRNRVDTWICVSAPTASFLVKNEGIPVSKVRTVEAFINPDLKPDEDAAELRRQAREFLGLTPDAFVVVGCGTVYWRKDPEIFIETARYVVADSKPGKIQFVWLGSGEDLERLRIKVREADLHRSVKLPGEFPNASKLLAAADLFFLSSKEDPFPLVCLEAAQFAIPTVYFRGSSGIGTFTKRDAGVAVGRRRAEAAADAIRKLIRTQRIRKALGREAAKRLHNEYTSEIAARKIFHEVRRAARLRAEVAIVIPNFNHERYIKRRIDSVLNQSIKDIDLILLDDCSTDDSMSVIQQYKGDPAVRIHRNRKNSGSPFNQWRKGVSLASSEVVWIAESDDDCDSNFLEALLPEFDDELVQLAVGRTEIIDEHGKRVTGALQNYYKRAHPSLFDKSYKQDGAKEVDRSISAICTYVNGSGLLMRRKPLAEELECVREFRMCGDWRIYLGLLRRGKVSFRADAESYFRRHQKSVVHNLEGTETYFRERYEISKYVVENFRLRRRGVRRMFEEIRHEWSRFSSRNAGKRLEDLYGFAEILEAWAKKRVPITKIGLYVHGFLMSRGGIERFASELGSELAMRGHAVTIFCRGWGGGRPMFPVAEAVDVCPVELGDEAGIAALRGEIIDRGIEVFVPMLSERLFEAAVSAAECTGATILVSEHNDPWKIEEQWWDRPSRQETFRRADAIHVLLERFRASLDADLQARTWVNPHGVAISAHNSATKAPRRKEIIVVARLEPQKRVDRAVAAFRMVAKDFPDWQLQIHGEGSERVRLQQLIEEEKLGGQVCLRGVTKNIEDEYAAASFLTLPSEFEGFGLVVLEAMRAGLPVVAFADCNGPNEIITQMADGILVDPSRGIKGLAAAFRTLMRGGTEHMRETARQTAARYSRAKVFDAWEHKIRELAEFSGAADDPR